MSTTIDVTNIAVFDVTNTAVFERRESQVRSYCRSVDAIFDTASGGIMRDLDGWEYIDFLSGTGSLNYGHNNPDKRAALIDYLIRDGITHGFASTEPPSPGLDLGPSLRALRSEVLRDNAETQRTALL
jgi:4-aminobutyrate aminotransferase-like enzyme